MCKCCPKQQEKRIIHYRLRDRSGEILSDVKSIRLCGKTPLKLDDGINVMMKSDGCKARYTGVILCGSIWGCPTCNNIMAQKRSALITGYVNEANQKNHSIVFATLTHRHNKGHSLKYIREVNQKAMKFFTSHRRYKELFSKLESTGLIRSNEITVNPVNGWHNHYHVLYFFKKEVDMVQFQKELSALWKYAFEHVAEKLGDYSIVPDLKHGVDVRDGSDVTEYLTKTTERNSKTWHVADEMTMSQRKLGVGESRTQWDLLHDATFGKGKVKAEATRLFREYFDNFKGSKQLVISPNIKQEYGTAEEEQTEEQVFAEASEEAEEETVYKNIPSPLWFLVCKYKKRAELLNACEKDYSQKDGRTNRANLLLYHLLELELYDESINFVAQNTYIEYIKKLEAEPV